MSENESLRTQLAQLTTTYEQLRNKTANSSSETARLHVELEASRELCERFEREVERLRQHLMETEDAQVQDALQQEEVIKEYVKQIEALERERSQWEEAAEQERETARAALRRVDETFNEMEGIREEMNQLRVEKEREALAAANLGRVLEEFQRGKENDIQFAVEDLRGQVEEMTEAMEEWRDRAVKAEERVKKVSIEESALEGLRKEISEKNTIIGKLRHDVIQLQTHLSEAMRRMRDAVSDEMVDRRLITNLIVGFLGANRGDPKRFEILSVIGSVLRFGDEERVKVGLARKGGGGGLLGGVLGGGGGGGSEREAVGEVRFDVDH